MVLKKKKSFALCGKNNCGHYQCVVMHVCIPTYLTWQEKRKAGILRVNNDITFKPKMQLLNYSYAAKDV